MHMFIFVFYFFLNSLKNQQALKREWEWLNEISF